MRSYEDMRADLANCDRDGTPWPAAAKRLLTDFPDLLGVVQAVEAAAAHPWKGPNDSDASMLLEAAKRIEDGYLAGGQHTRTQVGRVLRAVAAALAAAADAPQPEWDEVHDIPTYRLSEFVPQRPSPAVPSEGECLCGHDAGLHSASEPHPCTESNDRDWYCPCKALRLPSPAVLPETEQQR